MRRNMRWTYRPEIIDYVIESYAGTEASEGTNAKRRVFIWQDGEEILMGNTEAFTLHLAERFDLPLTTTRATDVHSLLRKLGERVLPPSPGKRRRHRPGRFRQPKPDSWKIADAEDE